MVDKVEDGVYRIENNKISEFELIGILKCVLFKYKKLTSKSDSNKTINSTVICNNA
jgi:hypothetical protein